MARKVIDPARHMSNLFDLVENDSYADWELPPLPLVASAGIKDIELDCETQGLRWWDGDRPGGIALGLPSDAGWRSVYLPYRHEIGPNHSPEAVREWANRELRGVNIANANTRFDIHTLREDGVDLEALGCTFEDVQHQAALLDDHRQRMSQESLCNDYLKDESKQLAVGNVLLDGRKMMSYPSGMVAVRAEADVRQVHKLRAVFAPMLKAQDLLRVKALEDKLIPVVCEMEKNGAPIDMEKLRRWVTRSEKEVKDNLLLIREQVGFPVDPKKNGDMVRVFEKLELPLSYTASGAPSFTDLIMKAQSGHPIIYLIRRTLKLINLRSKYLVADLERVSSNGILRYALHQLRATKGDEESGDGGGEAGTVSGRFSSTAAIADEEGQNIQQRMKAAKQRVAFGFEEDDETHDEEIYIIRELHIPDRVACPEAEWLAADAKQVEYRLFAHHANNPRIIQAYKDNPDLSFHKETHSYVKASVPHLTYRGMKDVNFMKIYGGGLAKMSLMLGFITFADFAELEQMDGKKKWNDPRLDKAKQIDKIYQREIPEVGPLLKRASHLAREDCADWCDLDDKLHRQYKHRGYVTTIEGRRARFPNSQRTHKALNCVIQGTAADIMKRKLIELHAAREYTGLLMRFTVHDEVDGDARRKETAERVREVLDSQSYNLRVPILWDVSTGATWKDCA
jgi:DNA polymerase-1